jgi:hypothetical protein
MEMDRGTLMGRPQGQHYWAITQMGRTMSFAPAFFEMGQLDGPFRVNRRPGSPGLALAAAFRRPMSAS